MTTDDVAARLGADRNVLLWSVASRTQLDTWEALVAANIANSFGSTLETPPSALWQAKIAHHFTLVAAAHLLTAARTLAPELKGVPHEQRLEIEEGRDLMEHWPENEPVFNTHPRTKEPPRSTGRRFAERNPGRTPYVWLHWTNTDGAMLMPHVPASALHGIIDRAQRRVLDSDVTMKQYVTPRPPSPWVDEPQSNGWWPRAENAEV